MPYRTAAPAPARRRHLDWVGVALALLIAAHLALLAFLLAAMFGPSAWWDWATPPWSWR